jgi:hypothetical protein
MIVVKLKGGIGNQMFQYAIGKSLACRNDSNIILDMTHFSRSINREFSLYAFSLSPVTTKISKLAYCFPFLPCKRLSRTINKMGQMAGLLKIVNESENMKFNFQKEVLNLKGNIYLDGYWQNEKYFKGIEDVIRRDFIFKKGVEKKNIKLLNLIKETNSVSVHVRRGDYINHPRFENLSIDYYKKSIETISKKIQNAKFFFFSDDISWIKRNIEFSNDFYFIDCNNKDYEDLCLMTKCKHHIIANSSFSWWGAWLGENKKKIIIAPQKWLTDFGKKKNKIKKIEIVPEKWICI